MGVRCKSPDWCRETRFLRSMGSRFTAPAELIARNGLLRTKAAPDVLVPQLVDEAFFGDVLRVVPCVTGFPQTASALKERQKPQYLKLEPAATLDPQHRPQYCIPFYRGGATRGFDDKGDGRSIFAALAELRRYNLAVSLPLCEFAVLLHQVARDSNCDVLFDFGKWNIQ